MAFIFSCSGEKQVEIMNDNMTDNQPIASVAISNQIKINEGNSLFLQGNFEEAIKYYEEGLRENRSIAFYNMGVSHYLLNNISEAEKYFQLAVSEEPEFSEALINLAVTQIQQGKLDEAESNIEGLIGDEPSAKLLVNMANLYLRKGETAKATLYYQQAVETGNQSKFVMSSYAYFLLAIGELDEGIRIIEGFGNKNYNDLFNLAKAYYLKGDHSKSLNYVRRAAGMNPSVPTLDLMAKDQNVLRMYDDEITTLNRLVRKSDNPDYSYRLAKALYSNGEYTSAENVIRPLINRNPDVAKYYFLYYDTLIMLGENEKASRMVVDAYTRLNNDEMLYLYARHILIFENNNEKAQKLIFSKPDSTYVNLAKTAYYIAQNKMLPAAENLKKVNPNSHNDYYMYRSYIAMKYRDYEESLRFSKEIDVQKPEYFWYTLANLVNLSKIAELRQHILSARERAIPYPRRPELAFHINPVIEDLHFSYRFEGSTEDILSVMMYPLFIEPDEMLSFLTLSYKLLNKNDKLVALNELQKSVRFSDGIKLNNQGVKLMLAHDYEGALEKFNNANERMENNTYTLYNLGLAKLNLGRYQGALTDFEGAVLQNRFNFPAHLASAVCYSEMGRPREKSIEYSQVSDKALSIDPNVDDVPGQIYFTKFLAEIGLGQTDIVLEDLSKIEKDNEFLKAVEAIAEYSKTKDTDSLAELNKGNIYRGKMLYDLLLTYNKERSPDEKIETNDRVYNFMKAYISMKVYNKYTDFNINDYRGDAASLREILYYNIFLERPREGLKYLKRISELDFRAPELYKASLYYFMWLEDFINAEASLTSLNNLQYTDKYVQYYKMLYFLLNYNDRRLLDNITNYMKAFPEDFRGPAMRIFYGMKEDDLGLVENELRDQQEEFGNFLEKMPVEIDIEGL